MKRIIDLLAMSLLGLLLTGCIEQDLTLKLNADGSGSLKLMRYLSDMENGISMLGEENIPSLHTLTVVSHSVHESTEKPGRQIEEAEYSFSNLAEALPELENLVPLMPRFRIQDDRLTVSVRHEMNKYQGFSSDSDTNAFCNLTIEFPVPPQSESGLIDGNRICWEADSSQIKEFRSSDIGTVLFECSVPADAVRLDLKPRLVEPRDIRLPGMEPDSPNLISSLYCSIPIVSSEPSGIKEDSNTKLDLFLPVDPNLLPLCYENLTIQQLIIDGKNIVPVLGSEPAGVFSGTGPQGQDAAGIPVSLKFGWNSPHLKRIDRIEAVMNAAVPEKTSLHSLHVEDAAPTNSILSFSDNLDERIAVTDMNHSFWQSAKLTFVTTLKPTDISMVWLDTDFGLRFPAKGIAWKSSENMYSYSREQGEKIFGEGVPFYTVDLYYKHIPTTSFDLVFSRVEKLTMKKLVLMEENIDVK